MSSIKDAISTNSQTIDSIQNPTCINNFETVTGNYCGEWAGATLKKLPVWGEQASNSEINFEWPTPEIFSQMLPDVSLQSLEFQKYHSDGSAVSSVRVNLSNGYSSPLFENFNWP